MADDKSLAWDLFIELRKELVELQRIRAQVIGFKITFVSAGIGVIAANLERIPVLLFVIPAFAAVFFDLLIHSYSFSIKRTGFYCWRHLEPVLRAQRDFPAYRPLWEEFMHREGAGTNVSFWGNLGITLLALVPAAVVIFAPFRPIISVPLLISFGILLAYDVWALYKPKRFTTIPRSIRQAASLKTGTSPKPCVAVLIVKDDPKLLLARRAVDPGKGKWDIPGGFIEPGESAEEAVAREIEEETSLKVMTVEYLGSVPDEYGDGKAPTLNLAFVAQVSGGDMTPRDDVASLHWVPLDQLPRESEMAFAHQEQVLQWCQERALRQEREKGKRPDG